MFYSTHTLNLLISLCIKSVLLLIRFIMRHYFLCSVLDFLNVNMVDAHVISRKLNMPTQSVSTGYTVIFYVVFFKYFYEIVNMYIIILIYILYGNSFAMQMKLARFRQLIEDIL